MRSLIVAILAFLCGLQAPAFGLEMSDYYSSGMVLQRGEVNVIKGKARPGSKVSVCLDGSRVARTSVDGKGDWQLSLPPQKAGRNHLISISNDGKSIELEDVAFGDIWLCAGQSNMEYSVGMFPYADQVAKSADSKDIRFFNVESRMDGLPRKDIAGEGWLYATGDRVKDLSAVGYFFGKNLSDSLDVPVGLISVNWSGTAIEPWMSKEALEKFPEFQGVLVNSQDKYFEEVEQAFSVFRKDWDDKHYLKGEGLNEKWYSPIHDFSEWKPINLPAYWENAGLEDYDGAVWFKTSFDIPEGFEGDTLLLDLNLIDDYDIAWVNGLKVGETFGNKVWRHYKVATDDLKAKGNVLVLRVFDIGDNGGLNFHPLFASDILSGEWVYQEDYRLETDGFEVPDIVNVSPFSSISVLYNGMLAPLADMKIKGVIWYQGESNVSRAADYEKLLEAMIEDWRRTFSKPDLPFAIVQLANFNLEKDSYADSEWAELRESQQRVSDKVEQVCMATAIDLGDAYDIHPHNKQEVGRRLAEGVLSMVYDRGSCYQQGPRLEKVEYKEKSVILTFDQDLEVKGKYGYVRGFVLSGESGEFAWAKAKLLASNKVEVRANADDRPSALRYLWEDNPGEMNLYGKDSGLPAHPFRTDTLVLSTEGKHYDFD
ncbi:sialate O-acetylesterase [Aureibacter tunicatorum]|uniref:Sialate O-acetylesterase n=1 Tax=Aureibacter tunicatorum TaxID=866807 RepID=A0AAE3XJV9_9BACT|nr:sialate O-acetylesterase [Aureibacter tunicatorum]MDR6237285.1 sialate O-acetylesterase [Aureibacter tunicatorum]BDD06276.1 9-O-acetylesterase [Aureibacter tunicatorum]